MPSKPNQSTALLQVTNLTINSEALTLVDGLSFEIERGETLAIVGESGSGKSISSLALLGLLPSSLEVTGTARLADIGTLPIEQSFAMSNQQQNKREKRLKSIRGARIAMIFQEPMTALNPLHTVGKQIAENLRLIGVAKKQIHNRTIKLLNDVNIKDAENKLARYPHELSGGQRQRVMIAMALAQNPDVLIADEPTTALDVTLQHEILELLNVLKQRRGMAMLLISHDLHLVRRYSDHIIVMKQGNVVERGKSEAIFANPSDDYTQSLISQNFGKPLELAANDDVTQDDTERQPYRPKKSALQVTGLSVSFPAQKSFLGGVKIWATAVDQVDIKLAQGHALGIVGESGSGKTTIALALTRLLSNQAKVEGDIFVDSHNINSLSKSNLRKFRSTIQMVFQDPFASLNPRFNVMQIIEEGLLVQGIDQSTRQSAVFDALSTVQLPTEFAYRYAHELSGGQRQRVALARAIIMRPKVIILDEPTSALDSSTQVAVVELLRDIQAKLGISYIFISHDLNVVRALCQHIMVMREGECVEVADSTELFTQPQHPYSKRLIQTSIDTAMFD